MRSSAAKKRPREDGYEIGSISLLPSARADHVNATGLELKGMDRFGDTFDVHLYEAHSNTDVVKPFVQTLWKMVCEPSTATCVSWTQDGSAITILQMEKFVSELVPRYFRHSNLSSFVRQLNTYGFAKRDSSYGMHVYWHPDFHRDFPERLCLIQRKKMHPLSTALISQPEEVAPVAASSTISSGHELQSILSRICQMNSRLDEVQNELTEVREDHKLTRQFTAKLATFLSHTCTDVLKTNSSGASINVNEEAINATEPPINVTETVEMLAPEKVIEREQLSYGTRPGDADAWPVSWSW